MKHSVLVVDDEQNMRRILEANLQRQGYHVRAVENGQRALEALYAESASAVITDLRMPGMDGMELLHKVRDHFSDTPVIVITAYGSVEAAVEALKLGAIDFITKPFDQDQITLAVEKAVRLYEANLHETRQKSRFEGKWDSIGKSPKMQLVRDLVLRTADSPSTVLISGESGTGKELIATAIHENSSRAGQPFIKINCAAIPETLVESEFFGHEKGAFTGAVTTKPGRFELANGGTLFLDEIGEISREMQVKLLRVLQEKTIERVGGLRTIPVDFRLVAATNRDLEQDVKNGDFRADLFYRLNVVPIHLPPLRERREDIPLLTRHFVEIFAERLKRNVTGVSDEGIELLQSYSWPGNIRELENVLERSVLLARGEVLDVGDIRLPSAEGYQPTFPAMPSVDQAAVATETDDNELRPLKEIVKEETSRLEREVIQRALRKNDGNVTRAAKELQISRKSLQLKMKEYELR